MNRKHWHTPVLVGHTGQSLSDFSKIRWIIHQRLICELKFFLYLQRQGLSKKPYAAFFRGIEAACAGFILWQTAVWSKTFFLLKVIGNLVVAA